MCGICGIVNLREGPDPSSELIMKMIRSLGHRGPDSSGYYRDHFAVLGHSRLAIIDLETGAQPLSNEDETLWITYNGEIFNYLELRDELESSGHKFSTKSDTETILHAWEEWGENCFKRFNGQWALAIWDTKKRELILSRDRFGIRPLYYTKSGNHFLFGSEIKALFCDERISREFDPSGLGEIFTFWSTVAPATAFKHINELSPGYYARLKNGDISLTPYWSVSFPLKSEGPEKITEKAIEDYCYELKSKLVDAVRLRFTRSDVPVGAYLSGGIDSSVISAIVSQYTNTKINTFSIRFKDSGYDEGKFQKEMSRRLGTEHNEILVSDRDIGESFPEVIRHTERPILRTAPAPLFLLSRLVRDSGYKVVVTGEGADEVLGGYDIFREAKVRRFIAQNPESSEIQDYLEQLYPWMERSPGNVPAYSRAFFSRNLELEDYFFSHRLRWNSTSSIMQMFSPDFRDQIGINSAENKLLQQIPDEYRDWSPLNRDQWLEYRTLLTGYILSAQGDRMLMANSVEGRFPFLDPLFVDFADTLPVDLKLKDLNEKYILKKVFSNLIPPSVLNRPKQPYRAPDAPSFFFRDKGPEWLEEITSEKLIKEAGVFNPAAVNMFLAKCRRRADAKMSNTDNMRIVGILSTMLCYKYFIKGENPSYRELLHPMTIIDRT